MLEGLKFHHIGVAAHDIEKELTHYSYLGYQLEGSMFVDPLQGVRGCFITADNQPRLEILVNHGESTMLNSWLENGIKFYHFAYETNDIFTTISELEKKRAKVIVKPKPAVAFNNRLICFLVIPNMLLIELIEQG